MYRRCETKLSDMVCWGRSGGDRWEFIRCAAGMSECWLCRRVFFSELPLIKQLFYVLQTLDSRDLKIFSVSANGQPARFAMGPKHSFKGTPLKVTLPFDLSRWLHLTVLLFVFQKKSVWMCLFSGPIRGQHVIVEVTYETSPAAPALQWLTAEQTAGKTQPYLFSQCQVDSSKLIKYFATFSPSDFLISTNGVLPFFYTYRKWPLLWNILVSFKSHESNKSQIIFSE